MTEIIAIAATAAYLLMGFGFYKVAHRVPDRTSFGALILIWPIALIIEAFMGAL